MRLLALDVGSHYIGLALSDPLGIIASPLPTMVRLTMEEDMAALTRLVREKGVTELVVGLPLNLRGIDTAQTTSVRSFAQVLREHLQLPLAFWDERFTTTIALRQLRQAGYKPSRQKGLADQAAAVLILQSYLEARSRKSEDDGD